MVAILLLSYFSVPKSGCKDSDFHRESNNFSKLYVYQPVRRETAGRRKVGRRQADKGPSGGWTDRQAADPAGILPAGRPGMTPIGALFPNKNIPLSATTGSGICKEPAKSRFAIPCRITSAVKRSGICQQTIGCRRFVRNLRFSPAAERCTAEVCPSRSAST